MARILFASLVVVALLAACGGDEGPPNGENGGKAGTSDASTPDGALRAFCAAAQAKDGAKLGGLIAPNPGERELLAIRKGEHSAEMLDDLAKLLVLREIGKVDIRPGGMTATVEAKLASRDEEFTMVKVGDVWLVSDF